MKAGKVASYAALDDSMLAEFYVAPYHQRQGIGTQLLTMAREAAGSPMSLYVSAGNQNARRFYVPHGFTVTAESDGSRNEEGEDGEPEMRYE